MNKSYPYPNIDIYLCKECKEFFELGDEIISLSEGYVDSYNRHNVDNRIIYHIECWEKIND